MDNNLIITNSELNTNSICFKLYNTKEPIIHIKNNGDIYVKGNLIENDIELVNALREFLKETGYLK
jgi:hypothetical protein